MSIQVFMKVNKQLQRQLCKIWFTTTQEKLKNMRINMKRLPKKDYKKNQSKWMKKISLKMEFQMHKIRSCNALKENLINLLIMPRLKQEKLNDQKINIMSTPFIKR